MKVLGFVFLALVLVLGGVILVQTGVWDSFVQWLQSIFH